ncbi:hypothetical protein [Streptomyces sp. NPDC058985]|uniref:IclR family transcriptional regulator domain-containing protein n=1 Tax=Streptomyces sp. NPDC058985 TaxID=3346684 RepID=UPI0036CDE80D
MDDLFHVTRQHVLLAVRDQAEALLVERLSARDVSPVLYRVGGRLPLTSTGVGLVLLAFAPTAAPCPRGGYGVATTPSAARVTPGG